MMTKKQAKKLIKIICELEAWQHTIKLTGQDDYDIQKAKKLLMKINNKLEST